MTYQIAKLAVTFFEKEYIGQNQAELWAWAVEKASAEYQKAKTQS
jgi:hypothetical protein